MLPYARDLLLHDHDDVNHEVQEDSPPSCICLAAIQ